MVSRTHIFPPEWAPQSRCWVGWPSFECYWQEHLVGAQRETATLVKALSQKLSVHVGCGDTASAQQAEAMLSGHATVHEVPMGDIWFRDTGPLFGFEETQRTGFTFGFNGWGGKYHLPGDQETAAAILAAEKTPEKHFEFILEGGSIDHNGLGHAGCLLTTRQCLLNPNRNRHWTQNDAETALRQVFPAEQIIWLEDGLIGDHTDGHVDNIARFARQNLIICQEPSGNDDPNKEILRAIETTLHNSRFEVATIPSPGKVLMEDIPAPASHMNFIFANGLLLFPVYNDKNAARAERVLASLFPAYEIVGLPADHLLTGGGAFHCMTQHVPEFYDGEQ